MYFIKRKMSENQLTNEDILRKLNKGGFIIDSEKDLNNASPEETKQIMMHFLKKYSGLPPHFFSLLFDEVTLKGFFTKPAYSEINLTTFSLSQELLHLKSKGIVSGKPIMINAQLEGLFSEQRRLINELYSYKSKVKPKMKRIEKILSSYKEIYEYHRMASEEIARKQQQITENNLRAEQEARDIEEYGRKMIYIVQEAEKEQGLKQKLEKSIEEKKSSLSSLDYVLEEEKGKADEIFALIREKEDQVLTGKDREAIEILNRTARLEANVKEEYEKKKMELNKAEVLQKALILSTQWTGEHQRMSLQIIELNRKIEVLSKEITENKTLVLSRLEMDISNSKNINSKLSQDLVYLNNNIDYQIKQIEEIKVQSFSLNEKLHILIEKEQILKEEVLSFRSSISTIQKKISEINSDFDLEQSQIENKMKEVLATFEASTKKVQAVLSSPIKLQQRYI